MQIVVGSLAPKYAIRRGGWAVHLSEAFLVPATARTSEPHRPEPTVDRSSRVCPLAGIFPLRNTYQYGILQVSSDRARYPLPAYQGIPSREETGNPFVAASY